MPPTPRGRPAAGLLLKSAQLGRLQTSDQHLVPQEVDALNVLLSELPSNESRPT
ncbi:hypothetical protein [Myxococcus qinghaiensis]|uniref:hypothetical protein n=1 Tax=Myxococcus qinghaiensis TaxID=2906758 RepID=UPI0020A776DF|nr:hypothetical protein [Myxococcus qinghaiensis]MCP3168746.1 hypothetical protein [Myxococcus qinghaiensis]